MRTLPVNIIDARLISILEQVSDPEVPVLSVLDLGVVRSASIDENNMVHLVITPTYAGCPAMDVIRFELNLALKQAGYSHITIETVLSPPWTTDWLTEKGRGKIIGLWHCPPVEKRPTSHFNGQRQRSALSTLRIPPHLYGLTFGSTACKSLYKCESCKEPFDYFKCH